MEAAEHRRMTEIDDLGELFSRVSRRFRRATLAALEPCGINPHQARALRMVIRHGPLRPSQLAQILGIALRSTTQVVDDLVELGLLTRVADPVDRRAVLVSASPAGIQRAEQISAIRGQQAHELLGGLSVDDRAELRRLLLILETGQAAR
ncbi:MAG: MarR family transcriptional regulator [Brooklawnia sp.]|uniref:MarR family winged helix-turn-helix transcriptional regulator n=1 Tax=Brooklawnia sp. TaxID=2699740 RepID=UPI003C7673B5